MSDAVDLVLYQLSRAAERQKFQKSRDKKGYTLSIPYYWGVQKLVIFSLSLLLLSRRRDGRFGFEAFRILIPHTTIQKRDVIYETMI